MPLYADFYAYGPSPVFSASHYSALLYLGSSGSSSYSSRIGSFVPPPSWSPLPTLPRLLPSPVSSRPRRFAPPSLQTISESSGSPILSSSPRLRSHYTAPRPIRIDTADIDVTSPRNRGPFDRSSDGTGDRKGSPKERAGTIKRGRTVVRLHTRRLKDGPPPSALAAVAKTAGERLAEKFYIRDSPSRDSPAKQRLKAQESIPITRATRVQQEAKRTEEPKDEKEESSEEEEDSAEEAELVKVAIAAEVGKDEPQIGVIQETKSKLEEFDGVDKTKPHELFREPKVKETKDEESVKSVDVIVGQVKSESLVDSLQSETVSVVGKILSPTEEKGIRVPKFVVGDVCIEVCHSPKPTCLKVAKRLRMQVEVVVEGEEKERSDPAKPSEVNAKTSTPGIPASVHSLPSSPIPDGSARGKAQPSKIIGDFPKLWAEKRVGAKTGESPKTAKALKVGDRKLEDAPAPKIQSAQVTPETPAIRKGEAEKRGEIPSKEEENSTKVPVEEVSKRGSPPASPAKNAKIQPGSNLKEVKKVEKQDLVAQKTSDILQNENVSGKCAVESQKPSTDTPIATISTTKLPAIANNKVERLPLIGEGEKVLKSKTMTIEANLATEAKDTKKFTNLEKQKKIIKESDVKLASQPIEMKISTVQSKEAISSLLDETQKHQKIIKEFDAKLSSQSSEVKSPTTKPKEVVPSLFGDKQKQQKIMKDEEIKLSTQTNEVKCATTQPKETYLIGDKEKQQKIVKDLDIKQTSQPTETKCPTPQEKEAFSSLSGDNVKEQNTTISKPAKVAPKPQPINSTRITDVSEKSKEAQNETDSPPSQKIKPNAKKEKTTIDSIPLIIEGKVNDQKNVKRSINSEADIPVKMIKIPYPQKSPTPKVIEKPPGLLARLLESEKMLQVKEPEKKTDAVRITEISGTKDRPSGTVSVEMTKVESKKDASKTPKEPSQQKTSSIPHKTSSPITPETPTKDISQVVNKSADIKADLKEEPKLETPATKTKPKTPVTKITQELRKPETTTDLKRVDKEEKEEKASKVTATPSKDSTTSPKKGERKTQISTDSANVSNKQGAEPPAEPKTKAENKVAKKKSPEKLNREVSKKAIPEEIDAKKIPSAKDLRDKTPAKVEESKEMKAKEKSTNALPPMIVGEDSEKESDSEESEEDSEEESEEETEEESSSDDDEERQLVEEAIKRASIPGTSAAPAKSLPRFRDYHEKDFLFLRVLGKGSFGKVFLAVLRDTDRHYAVKCLKKQSVIEEEDVECTLIERKVLSLGTAHPYLCHLFCTFQSETHLFFVMEYLNGGDLMFHIQRNGKFELERAQFYAAEIVSGLKFLHKKSIVYRDLKLDNILLDHDGHIRIADFGMCKLQIFLDRTADSFCGTPDYIAPEIIKGYRYNQTVDWWSFGVLLYEMLVGQSPFTGCDEDELFWSICNENPLFPRFLTRDACDILARLLNKDADRRLGAHGCPAGDVCDQPFFRSIDWWRLERKELVPPFKPALKHPLDLKYFETTFTCEKAKLTPIAKLSITPEDQLQFDGFSYTNPNATD